MNEILVELFMQLISQEMGLHIRHQDRDSIRQKISLRLKALKCTPEKYYQLLESHSEQGRNEWRELALLLTTTESYFMRDRGQFSLLEQVIFPELIASKKELEATQGLPKQLRIWSAGCSTGEEPYSLAILVQELIPDWKQWDILIVGTDINEEALEKAKRGIYGDWSFRLVNPNLQQKYFHHYKSDWIIHNELRKLVAFKQGNLVRDDYPNFSEMMSNMDLIICRNVFVYFEHKYITLVLKKFYNTLKPGGFLMTGHAELHGQGMAQFQAKVFPESVIYQRKQSDRDESTPLGQPTPVRHEYRSSSSSAKAIPSLAIRPLQSLPITAMLPIPPALTKDCPLESVFSLIPSMGASVKKLPPSIPALPTPSELTTSPASHNSKNAFSSLLKEAESLFHKKAYSEAIKKAQEVLKISQNNFDAYYLLAQIHANLGHYSEATNYCKKAIELDSFSIFPYYLLAHISEEQGDLETAKIFFKKIIYLCPSCIVAYLELGNIYLREGNIKRAHKMYTNSCEILKTLPASAPIEQMGKMTAGELLNHVRETLLKLAVQ